MHILAENSIPLPQDKTARMNIKNNNNNFIHHYCRNVEQFYYDESVFT